MAEKKKDKDTEKDSAKETTAPKETGSASGGKGAEAPKETATETGGKESVLPQPPPPGYESGTASPGAQTEKDDKPDGHEKDEKHEGHWHWHHMEEAAEAIYSQLLEVRRIVDRLQQEALDAKTRKKYEMAPVMVSDLMTGFQAAVARANRATSAGEGEGEDIERMSIKDLEVSIDAPVIESGHAGDPVIMLPNINSADNESARVTLKFSVVSVPIKQRG